jgi:hydrogenase expression/formation protein HypD
MKYIDGFRNPDAAKALAERLSRGAEALKRRGRGASIMEVCGTHTMAIGRYGIRDILPENVNLISGPGCPVCVTDPGYIDAAVDLARRGVVIATFGDMLLVPGSSSTLAECRAEGGRIEICYSPAAAVELAARQADDEVVFLAIGFETTVAPVVSTVALAQQRGVGNISLLTAFKRVPPALAALLADPEISIDAFLCPAHVSAIIGASAYEPFSGGKGVPCVIAGFEPLDILLGLDGILTQIESGESRVENQYTRVVRPEGNLKAQQCMQSLLEPADAAWRGIGVIPDSGYDLRARYAEYDAARKHGLEVVRGKEHPTCLCGDVIKGKCRPPDCPLFAKACTPDHAIGPCMVSAEGTCAAYFKYCRLEGRNS